MTDFFCRLNGLVLLFSDMKNFFGIRAETISDR